MAKDTQAKKQQKLIGDQNLEAEMDEEEDEIKEQEPVMARDKKAKTLGVPKVPVHTNVFGLRIRDTKTAVYRYDVRIWRRMGTKVLELTKKTRDDFNGKRMMKSVTALGMAIDGNPQVFGENNCRYFFDGHSILHCLTQINFPDKQELYFETDINVTDHPLLGASGDFHIEVKPVKDNFQVTLADLKKATNDLRAGKDRSAHQFPDIITSTVSKLDRFVIFPNGKIPLRRPRAGFPGRDCPDLGEQKRLVDRVDKAVRMIEGPEGRGSTSPAVAIDSLKAASHVKELVLDKFIEVTKIDNFDRPVPPKEIERAATVMKGLMVRPIYDQHAKPHKICGISRETALKMIGVASDDLTTLHDMTVERFYQQKYGANVRYPMAPLARVEGGDCTVHVPMELLMIVNQFAISPRKPKKLPAVFPSLATSDEDSSADDFPQRIIDLTRATPRLNDNMDEVDDVPDRAEQISPRRIGIKCARRVSTCVSNASPSPSSNSSASVSAAPKMCGPRPSSFTVDDSGERFYVGSEVATCLNCTGGNLYKKYPLLWKRNATVEEKKKLPEPPAYMYTKIMLLRQTEVDEILNGEDDKFKVIRKRTMPTTAVKKSSSPDLSTISLAQLIELRRVKSRPTIQEKQNELFVVGRMEREKKDREFSLKLDELNKRSIVMEDLLGKLLDQGVRKKNADEPGDGRNGDEVDDLLC